MPVRTHRAACTSILGCSFHEGARLASSSVRCVCCVSIPTTRRKIFCPSQSSAPPCLRHSSSTPSCHSWPCVGQARQRTGGHLYSATVCMRTFSPRLAAPTPSNSCRGTLPLRQCMGERSFVWRGRLTADGVCQDGREDQETCQALAYFPAEMSPQAQIKPVTGGGQPAWAEGACGVFRLVSRQYAQSLEPGRRRPEDIASVSVRARLAPHPMAVIERFADRESGVRPLRRRKRRR